MYELNVDNIINGTPDKRILNAYNKMKADYNQKTAADFYNVYKNEKICDIINNSRLIFSEPYYGLNFYSNLIEKNIGYLLSKIKSEVEKVKLYLQENRDRMPDNQRMKYEELLTNMLALITSNKNAILYAKYIKNIIDDKIESKLLDTCKCDGECNDDEVCKIIEESDPVIFFTYSPYCYNRTSNPLITKRVEDIFKDFASCNKTDIEKFRKLIAIITCLNKLSCDDTYKKCISEIPHQYRGIYNYLATRQLKDILKEGTSTPVSVESVVYNDPQAAINFIFSDMNESAFEKEIDMNIKAENEQIANSIYESVIDIMYEEYLDDDSVIATGYTLLEDGNLTIADYFNKVNEMRSELSIVKEGKYDVSEEDLDKLDDTRKTDQNTNISKQRLKKAEAPSSDKMTNLQNKYMDKEIQQYKKMAEKEMKGLKTKNAVKAVTTLPLNILNKINSQIHSLDRMDDERRKKFMTEPGFRKNAVQNVKLAILYGTAASVKLSLIPVTMLLRHFSKEKDIRIRNELVRELETDVKITEEKINDASVNGNTTEKYRLMRIREQLKAEVVRVRINAKYT